MFTENTKHLKQNKELAIVVAFLSELDDSEGIVSLRTSGLKPQSSPLKPRIDV